MNQDAFHDFARAACARTLAKPGFIGRLRLTSPYRAEQGAFKIREPELCQALIQEAEALGYYYGLEVPTDLPYRFTPLDGEGKRRALHDFVLFGTGEADVLPRVRVELKEGSPSPRRDEAGQQVDVPALSKDLRKLLFEPSVDGRAVLHVLQASDEGTLPSLLGKYRLALQVALAEVAGQEPVTATWFSLVFFAVRRRGPRGGDRPALWHIPRVLAGPGEQLSAGDPLDL